MPTRGMQVTKAFWKYSAVERIRTVAVSYVIHQNDPHSEGVNPDLKLKLTLADKSC
jgi:hypothetical protein